MSLTETTKEQYFTEGTPSTITVSESVKLSTKPYESIDFFASITLAVRDDADIKKAYDQAYAFIENIVLKPKVEAVRAKYPGAK